MEGPDLQVDLALLLTAEPPAAAIETAWRLAGAAAAKGCRVGIFMMGAGVHAAAVLGERRASGEAEGVVLVRCAQNARERGARGHPAVWEGSQADWARMVARARRVLALG